MTEPLISVTQLKKTSVEAIVAQDIDFLTKLNADVTSFLSRITKDMQTSYLKYVRSKVLMVDASTPKKWVFNFSVGDPRPEYHFIIIKTFQDQGYVIKKSEFKKGYYLVSDLPFDEESETKQPFRLRCASDEILLTKENQSMEALTQPSSPHSSETLTSRMIPVVKGLFDAIHQMTHKLAHLDQLFISTQSFKK